ncbi:MAG: hypothetical protein NWE94_03440 [Candidatus Bathyarchaeota archaeon]|nr:hypothetical protein [Candidatus Bathyarchaeota archaeon]
MTTNTEDKNASTFDLDSKFMRVLLVLVAVLLIFIGPTYVPYALSDLMKVDYAASAVLGIILLATGLALVWYLIRKKIIE